MHRIAFVSLLVLCCSSVLAEELCVCRYCQGLPTSRDEPGDVTAGRKYAPDRLVDVLNIRIDVTPNWTKRTIQGETTITMSAISRPVREVQLDAVDLRVESVEGSQEIEEFVNDGRRLVILFAEPLKIGRQASVTVRYTCEPKQGLYFRTKELGYADGDMHLWTQGEPHTARHWFPCFDYPNERSTTEVICRVDPELTVLSNGRVMSKEVDAETGLKAVHWKQEKPHASYLICLAAGRFEKLEDSCGDVPLGFYTQPSLAEHAKNSFADTARIMAFYNQEIGVPYPWDKYDQVTCVDFLAGGMENTTLTALTDRTVFSTETENIHSSRNLDAHEMAHQWFGDYVTCEDWSHLWLNEGFATYYTHLYNEHRLGRNHLLYGLYRDAQNKVFTKQKDTRPIVFRGYSSAGEQFDFRAYPKGSWVLHMLRNQLGKEVYRQAITSYLQKHALSSVSTPDLMAELEDASGQSLDRFFDQWVYHGGFPNLKIAHKWLPEEKLAKVTITQTQETSDKVLLFHLPATLRFMIGDQVIDRQIGINEKEQDFFVPLSAKPDIVRFDPDYALLAKVDFNKSQEMLEAQLKNHQDLTGRLLAIKALSKKDNQKAREALSKALSNDSFYGVRVEAAKALGKSQSDQAFELLTKSPRQPDARVRQAVVKAVGQYYRPAALDWLLRVVKVEQNPEIVGSAINAVASYNEARAYEALRSCLSRHSFRESLAVAAITACAKTGDAALAPDLLRTLSERRHEFTDRGLGDALKALGKLAGEMDDTTPSRRLIEECLNSPAVAVRRSAVEALGELGDVKSLPALQALAESDSNRVAGAAREAVAKIEKEAPITPSEVGELRKLVRELQEQQEKLQEQVEELRGKKGK